MSWAPHNDQSGRTRGVPAHGHPGGATISIAVPEGLWDALVGGQSSGLIEWGHFVTWAAIGAGYCLAVLGALSIGILVLPVAVGAKSSSPPGNTAREA